MFARMGWVVSFRSRDRLAQLSATLDNNHPRPFRGQRVASTAGRPVGIFATSFPGGWPVCFEVGTSRLPGETSISRLGRASEQDTSFSYPTYWPRRACAQTAARDLVRIGQDRCVALHPRLHGLAHGSHGFSSSIKDDSVGSVAASANWHFSIRLRWPSRFTVAARFHSCRSHIFAQVYTRTMPAFLTGGRAS